MKTTELTLLEFIQYILACEYISDLKTDIYNEKAMLLLDRLDLAYYSLNSIKDAVEYLSSNKTQT